MSEVATVPVVELVVPPGFPTSPALVRAFFIFVNIDGIFDSVVYACCDWCVCVCVSWTCFENPFCIESRTYVTVNRGGIY